MFLPKSSTARARVGYDPPMFHFSALYSTSKAMRQSIVFAIWMRTLLYG